MAQRFASVISHSSPGVNRVFSVLANLLNSSSNFSGTNLVPTYQRQISWIPYYRQSCPDIKKRMSCRCKIKVNKFFLLESDRTSSNLSCYHLAYQHQLIFLNQFTLVTKIIASCLGELQKQGCPAKCRHHSRPVSKFIIPIATKP